MPARAPVRTLFLDAGGVLVDPDWDRVSARVASLDIRVDPADLARADPRARRDLDEPAVVRSSDDRARGILYFGGLLRYAGVEAAPAVLERAAVEILEESARANLWTRVAPGVPAALDRLRAAGLRLAVVSNADGTLARTFERLGLRDRVDVLLDSAVVGVEKPDPRIFREAVARSGADPGSTVHVGDFFHIDVVGARAAGLRAVLVDPLGLHADRDCERTASLAAYADALLARG
jgi:putative hydrolase of the HAD superfamily